MASDTATGATTVATDDCVGFAEPAQILTRLTPDDLHPARLAGPHAWHPWGLTVAPPTDRHLRLILPQTGRADSAEQLIHRLESKLTRTPWPPEGPLKIRHDSARLDCRDDTRRALIEVSIAGDGEGRGQAEVVTRNGWPILDELAALNDRIRCIDVDEPSPTDLADLASWVRHKMAEPSGVHRLDASLPKRGIGFERGCAGINRQGVGGSVEAMWTCIGTVQPITPTTSMSASPTRARQMDVGSRCTGIPRLGGFSTPILAGSLCFSEHPQQHPTQLPRPLNFRSAIYAKPLTRPTS